MELKILPQEYSSKETCHNHWQLPQLFKLATFEEGTTCVDYGGGAFDTSVKFLEGKGVTAKVYDPYNRGAAHNEAVLSWVEDNGGVDYVTSSNVLNVIKEEEVRLNVLRNMQLIAKPNATIYFVIYEGNRSGIGAYSGKGWQNHCRAAEYLSEIKEVFPDAVKKGSLIIAHNKEGEANA